MELILTKDQQEVLKVKHRIAGSKFEADRIKCILYLSNGKSEDEVSELLLVGKSTIYSWIKEFIDDGMDNYLKDRRGGSTGSLSKGQKNRLFRWIDSIHPQSVGEVMLEIEDRFGITYSQEAVRKLLHRMGFSYKKSKIIPQHPAPEIQEEFVREYEELRKNTDQNDQIYFVDAAHLIFNTEAAFAWILKECELFLPAQTGRQRINELGAYSPITKEVVVIEDENVCNANTVIELFRKLKTLNPKADHIHIYLDNVKYHRARIIRDFVKGDKIMLHYLPSYSPNLNLIERLWRLLRKKVKKNKFYRSFSLFKNAIHEFFEWIKYDKSELDALLTENFEIINIF